MDTSIGDGKPGVWNRKGMPESWSPSKTLDTFNNGYCRSAMNRRPSWELHMKKDHGVIPCTPTGQLNKWQVTDFQQVRSWASWILIGWCRKSFTETLRQHGQFSPICGKSGEPHFDIIPFCPKSFDHPLALLPSKPSGARVERNAGSSQGSWLHLAHPLLQVLVAQPNLWYLQSRRNCVSAKNFVLKLELEPCTEPRWWSIAQAVSTALVASTICGHANP